MRIWPAAKYVSKGGTFRARRRVRLVGVALALSAALGIFALRAVRTLGNSSSLQLIPDSTGLLGTLSAAGSFDTTNPFFKVLGTNGRSCATCHVMENAWTFTPANAQARFVASHGTDPLFRTVDGSNCPDSPGVNDNPPAASAYSMLLNKGVIRVSLPIPANAQFTVSVVSDPYGCAMTTDSTGQKYLSLYRRPLPATNLGFLSAVMLDGRETIKPLNDPSTFQSNLMYDLEHQAMDATLGHAQASSAPDAATLEQIAAFEAATFTAQQVDNRAGDLSSQGATGGPVVLSTQNFFPGINDSLGGNPTGAAFNPNVFTLFANLSAPNPPSAALASIARGEAIFDSAPVTIQDVKGLNDTLGKTTIVGTCGTCHDAPNVGDHSLSVPLDIGIADVPSGPSDPLAIAQGQLNEPKTPVYAVTCSTSLGAPVNQTFTVTDPGRAMISGRCADIGKVKGPILRGLSARAPYFHNGAADSLEQVVNFYNERFQLGLTANEMTDLVNFLKSL